MNRRYLSDFKIQLFKNEITVLVDIVRFKLASVLKPC